MQSDRMSEWFVPKFGSKNFRISVGILFLPYTSIVTCFAIWGSLSQDFDITRLLSIALIYFLSVGISAHCLDAVGGRTKPWGELPKRKIFAIAILALGIAFSIGIYYAVTVAILLIPIGIIESFFLFAYNLELFGGKFHNNPSTVFSWGILPVFAGAIIQTNSISIETLILSGISAFVTYALITTSRKYKELKRIHSNLSLVKRKEIILKSITFGVIGGTIMFFLIKQFL